MYWDVVAVKPLPNYQIEVEVRDKNKKTDNFLSVFFR